MEGIIFSTILKVDICSHQDGRGLYVDAVTYFHSYNDLHSNSTY